MKIFITGPSASGKTYLANHLARKTNETVTSLDYVLYKHRATHNRTELPDHEWQSNLHEVLKKENWIIEGVNLIDEVMDKADIIIFLRQTVAQSLVNQWWRYISDPIQRKEHGFINNLKLSSYIIRQYLQTPDTQEMNNLKYSRLKKTQLVLKRYNAKVIELTSRNQINSILPLLPENLRMPCASYQKA